jgi:hypothetical protein
MSLSAVAAAVLIAASANNIAKAAYAIGQSSADMSSPVTRSGGNGVLPSRPRLCTSGRRRLERILLSALALLGFATAAAYLV